MGERFEWAFFFTKEDAGMANEPMRRRPFPSHSPPHGPWGHVHAHATPEPAHRGDRQTQKAEAPSVVRVPRPGLRQQRLTAGPPKACRPGHSARRRLPEREARVHASTRTLVHAQVCVSASPTSGATTPIRPSPAHHGWPSAGTRHTWSSQPPLRLLSRWRLRGEGPGKRDASV